MTTDRITDDDLAAIRGAVERAELFDEETLPLAFTDRKRLLAEVDRLRAENTAMAEQLEDQRGATRVAEAARLRKELVDTTEHLVSAMRVVRDEAEQLRAENTAHADRIAAFLEPHQLVIRNIAWFDQDGVLHVTEHTVCDHCVPQFTQFNRREDIPEGPCAVRRALDGGDATSALGLDQDGAGNA